jgi:hypothetical protein
MAGDIRSNRVVDDADIVDALRMRSREETLHGAAVAVDGILVVIHFDYLVLVK